MIGAASSPEHVKVGTDELRLMKTRREETTVSGVRLSVETVPLDVCCGDTSEGASGKSRILDWNNFCGLRLFVLGVSGTSFGVFGGLDGTNFDC